MTSITDRYASSIRSKNLRSEPDTTNSDTDVLGAFGLAGKQHPLAVALARLLSGDNHAEKDVVATMAGMLDGKAYRIGVEITRPECVEVAQAVLAWYRHGTCKTCNGLGVELMKSKPVLSDKLCKACRGTRRIPFARQFAVERVELAQWMLAEVERELSKAGAEAMKALAPRLEL